MSSKNSKPSYFSYSALGTVVFILVAGFITVRLTHRASAQPEDRPADAVPVAGVAPVTRADLSQEVSIAAEFRPYAETELNAKVSGYVSHISVDFGDKVKAGQLLATLEVPELLAQLANAQAVEQKTEADYTNADLIHTRLVAVNHDHPNLVAQQELDTAAANAHATAAAIAAARADVAKYQTMVSYTNITAPFDGVVTRRYVDPGQLIQAGTSSGRPLLRVSDNYRLRLDFPVTVDYVKDIRTGDPVTVRVDSLDGKLLSGNITRFAQEVDDTTRTMTTEIEVPNPQLELTPGMYATVTLKVEKRPNVLSIPVEAVSGGKKPVVFVVNRQNEIEERPVTLGLETPDRYEVTSGLHEGEMVVIGNRAAFQAGEHVEPKVIQLSMRTEN